MNGRCSRRPAAAINRPTAASARSRGLCDPPSRSSPTPATRRAPRAAPVTTGSISAAAVGIQDCAQRGQRVAMDVVVDVHTAPIRLDQTGPAQLAEMVTERGIRSTRPGRHADPGPRASRLIGSLLDRDFCCGCRAGDHRRRWAGARHLVSRARTGGARPVGNVAAVGRRGSADLAGLGAGLSDTSDLLRVLAHGTRSRATLPGRTKIVERVSVPRCSHPKGSRRLRISTRRGIERASSRFRASSPVSLRTRSMPACVFAAGPVTISGSILKASRTPTTA